MTISLVIMSCAGSLILDFALLAALTGSVVEGLLTLFLKERVDWPPAALCGPLPALLVFGGILVVTGDVFAYSLLE